MSSVMHEPRRRPDGGVYGWGYGEDARLRLELTEHQYVPRRYPGPRALTLDHEIVIFSLELHASKKLPQHHSVRTTTPDAEHALVAHS